MLPLISIIMPIYNADKFLAKSLDSILNQSFQEYELILLMMVQKIIVLLLLRSMRKEINALRS